MNVMTEQDIRAFMQAADGEWECIRVEKNEDGNVTVIYRSLVKGIDVKWSHQPFPFCKLPAIGTKFRFGMVPLDWKG